MLIIGFGPDSPLLAPALASFPMVQINCSVALGGQLYDKAREKWVLGVSNFTQVLEPVFLSLDACGIWNWVLWLKVPRVAGFGMVSVLGRRGNKKEGISHAMQ